MGCSASAYTDNLTDGMMHEIRARVADMERKDAERDQKAAEELLEMELNLASKSQRNGWKWNKK